MITTCPIADDLPALLRDPGLPGHSEPPEVVQARLEHFMACAGAALRGRAPEERREFRDRVGERLAVAVAESALLRAIRGRREVGTLNFDALRLTFANTAQGDEPLVVGFERFLLQSAPLSALRARRIFARRELAYRCRLHGEERPFQSLSLGAGPEPEGLEHLLERPAEAARLQVTLVDADKKALEQARARADAAGVGAALRCVAADPVRLALAGGDAQPADLDFVCSLGGFDYLPDPLVVHCVEDAFQRLRPGGEILMAFYHRDLSAADRLIMEWWLHWFPYFRSGKDIATLLRRTSIPNNGRLAGMSRGPNYYVIIQKNP